MRGCTRYGLDEWNKLFTKRQMLALTTLGDLLIEVRQMVERDSAKFGVSGSQTRLRDGGQGSAAYADAVVTYLALAISKGLDFNCTLASWDSTNVKIRNVFARQAISMTWDFAEANVLGSAVGSFHSMVSSLKDALLALPVAKPGHSAGDS